MIYINSKLKCIDNSGAILVKCLKVLSGKSSKSFAVVGDLVVVSISSFRSNKKVKKGEIYKGIIVRTRKRFLRHGGIFIYCQTSAVVLLNNRLMPLGTRIIGPILKEVKERGHYMIVSLVSSLI